MTHWLFAGLIFLFFTIFSFLLSSVFLFLCARVGRDEMHFPLVFRSSRRATRVPVFEHPMLGVVLLPFSSTFRNEVEGRAGVDDTLGMGKDRWGFSGSLRLG